MYQPAGFGGHRVWRRSNVQVAGIMIAGNCVICITFLGFGLLLIGTLSYAASTAFEPKPNDPPLFRNQPNVPRLIGKIFLGIGGTIFGVGLILLFIVIKKAKKEARNNQGQAGANVTLAGTTYPGSNYVATQPYAQPNTQFQPYSSNAGQNYPSAPGQGQFYQPVISGQGQPCPQGPGQPYQQGPGQPYPPVTGQGQPYPQGPGQEQPYLPTGSVYPHPVGGQPYPPTGGHTDKSTDPANLPYNPGHPYQTPPSGYPASGHPQPDVPPPYSNY